MTAEDMPLHSPSRTEEDGCTWQALLTLCTVPVLHVLSGLILELAPRKTLHLEAGQTQPNPRKRKNFLPSPTQSNPWMDPTVTHVHVCHVPNIIEIGERL